MTAIEERIKNIERKREFQMSLLRQMIAKPDWNHVVCARHYREHVRYHVRPHVLKIRECDAQLAHLRGLLSR